MNIIAQKPYYLDSGIVDYEEIEERYEFPKELKNLFKWQFTFYHLD